MLARFLVPVLAHFALAALELILSVLELFPNCFQNCLVNCCQNCLEFFRNSLDQLELFRALVPVALFRAERLEPVGPV